MMRREVALEDVLRRALEHADIVTSYRHAEVDSRQFGRRAQPRSPPSVQTEAATGKVVRG